MKKGFTLLELLIVLGIISTLIVAGIGMYSYSQKKSRDAKRKADLENIRTALELYRSNNNTYPATATFQTDLVPTYIPRMPTDPFSQINKYNYQKTATDYDLGAKLETVATANSCNGLVCTVTGTTPNCNYCLGPYGPK